jgi:tetratricopeptide (TPR) repeat protein
VPRRRRWRAVGRVGLALLAFLAGSFGPSRALEPEELLHQLRTTALDPALALPADGARLALGPGTLAIERGVLLPATTRSGITTEYVFVGQARFELEPPDEIEAGQIELFTGERSLDTPVDEAVLVTTNPGTLAQLVAHPPRGGAAPDLVERARSLHAQWLDRPERRKSGVEASLFRSLVGDAAFGEYFALWCRSPVLGEFLYEFDPEEAEPIKLASFTPIDLSDWDERLVRRQIRLQQRKDRWLDARVEDLGAWDVWLSTAWSPQGGTPPAGDAAFEAEHYELDVKLERHRLDLDGHARLRLVAGSSGRRAVRLDLFPDLQVRGVTDGAGRDLFFFRSAREVVVVLPEPSRAGERLTLDVRYAGRALQWIGGQTYDLIDTAAWYPHCAGLDRATYDVTLRWPQSYELVSGGTRVEGGLDGRYRWERKRLDRPAIAFSFVLGEFDIDRTEVDGVELVLAWNRGPERQPTTGERTETLEIAARALRYFESVFGDYPLDSLTLVTVPRGYSKHGVQSASYSQSYLGFVTLVDSIIRSGASWHRDMTLAHEIAHQWWGNLVAWQSYRDQWLSEGMASYSALMFDASRDDSVDLLAVMSAGWRQALTQTTLEGRTVESVGPVVLGGRLNSSRASNAYRPIVYRKGAAVLAMLARAVGPDRFHEVLGQLARDSTGQVLTTSRFVEAVGELSGMDLDGFASQYIYGTGIPQVHYDYGMARRHDAGWSIEGRAERLTPRRFRVEVVAQDDGGWDVLRLPREPASNGAATLVVPYSLILDDPTAQGLHESATTRLRREGRLLLGGEGGRFVIESWERPLALELDPRGEVLASFFATQEHPQRVLRHRAESLVAEGRLAEAEAVYREALATPGAEAGSVDPLQRGEIPVAREDATIRLGLARLYLDQRRLEDAEAELDAVDVWAERRDPLRFRMERDVLRGRLEIARGDAASALRRLRKTLKLAATEREDWRHMVWRLQLNSERTAVAEGFALLAVAALETRDEGVLEWAMQHARQRGVDLSPLQRVASHGSDSIRAEAS